MAIDKYILGMAGEYAVCSEVLRRGRLASITMGNAKAMDILVFDEKDEDSTYKVIEVKTTQSNKFVTNFFQKYYDKSVNHPDVWVFVKIDKDLKSRFFVLTHEELAIIQMQRNGMSSWERSFGCDNVLLKDILVFENQWGKI